MKLMHKISLNIVILFVISVCVFGQFRNMYMNVDDTLNNAQLIRSSGVLLSSEGQSLLQCALRCTASPACPCVLYNAELRYCRLLMHYMDESNTNRTLSETGWRYFFNPDGKYVKFSLPEKFGYPIVGPPVHTFHNSLLFLKVYTL